MKVLLATTIALCAVLLPAGAASASQSIVKYGYGADGTLMTTTCEVHRNYQVCDYWSPV